ncbi:MAG: malto-oligosyltrehalose trehalohydrolase [Pseudomonadota bacterium]
MPFGTDMTADGVRFRLWAPLHDRVSLKLEGAGPLTMSAAPDGWHEISVPGAAAGTRYRFMLPDGMEVPDPASRFQPDDVHGPSEVIDPRAYAWACADWAGRPWEDMVLYELHVGAFTPEGTFRAAIERLDHLRDLGVTGIELMPVADFPGARNWGYDGVLPFAPDSSYGRPEDMKAFVDAAHARGISMLLDVVYNHFGPDGNYLPLYTPVFNAAHTTPWGAAVNFDGTGASGIRNFVVENAAYWIREFQLDGLRLDAVHAIADDSATHILDDIAEAARAAGEGRPVHLILENEENEAARLDRDGAGRVRRFTAQWADDVHHVLHVAASGESAGYYADYAGDTGLLARALAEGFAFQGEVMPYRGSARGEPSAHLPPSAFVSFIQNHDQVGNRAFGDRITAFAPASAVRAIAAIYLLAPQIPMLFMGEEWGAAQPFPFFCDFGSDLADAVRTGRRAEFARFPEFQDPTQRERIPDPTALETFQSATLDWNEAAKGEHAQWHAWYRRVLALRHAEIIPLIAGIAGHSSRHQVLGDRAVRVVWRLADHRALTLVANLKAEPEPQAGLPQGRLIFLEGAREGAGLAPWSVAWILTEEMD